MSGPPGEISRSRPRIMPTSPTNVCTFRYRFQRTSCGRRCNRVKCWLLKRWLMSWAFPKKAAASRSQPVRVMLNFLWLGFITITHPQPAPYRCRWIHTGNTGMTAKLPPWVLFCKKENLRLTSATVYRQSFQRTSP